MKKQISLLLCICLVLGGCAMPQNRFVLSTEEKSTQQKIEEVNSSIKTNLSAAFEKGLEIKYGEKFIVNKEKSAAPTMMYPTYRTEAYPESNPELTFRAKCTTLKDGVALNIEDGCLTRKFIPEEQAILEPILSQYFTEYRCLGGLGDLYNSSWMDKDTTFEEFFDYYSKNQVGLTVDVPSESSTPEYVEEIAPKLAKELEKIYPIGSLSIYLEDNFNQENEKFSYKIETIYWGEEESQHN